MQGEIKESRVADVRRSLPTLISLTISTDHHKPLPRRWQVHAHQELVLAGRQFRNPAGGLHPVGPVVMVVDVGQLQHPLLGAIAGG